VSIWTSSLVNSFDLITKVEVVCEMSLIPEMSASVREGQMRVIVRGVGAERFSPRDEQAALQYKNGCRVRNLRWQRQF
jgi:hypothetical protein